MTTSAPRTGWLTAEASGLPTDPVLVFGGEPATFTVTLRNGSDSTYRDISPLVSIGHCSCSTTGAALAPAGTLAELDTSSGSWRTVDYVAEGTGLDYLFSPVQQPPFKVAPGATASFTFKLAISPIADQPPREHAGKTSIDVTIVTVPSRKVIGHMLVVPITVAMPTS
jgi:hypothetical protein